MFSKIVCREFFEVFLSVFVETVERLTYEKETNKKTTVPPNKLNKTTALTQSCLKFSFCESKLKIQKLQ